MSTAPRKSPSGIRIRHLSEVSPATVRPIGPGVARRGFGGVLGMDTDGIGGTGGTDGSARTGGVPGLRGAPADDGSVSRPRLRLVDDFGPVSTQVDDLPDPRVWTGRVAVALYEAATGARPATQVMRWLAPEVYDAVVRRSGRAARRGRNTRRPVRLRHVRADLVPGDTSVVEACAILDDHRRVRAMALRFEGLDGRWLVTACEIG